MGSVIPGSGSPATLQTGQRGAPSDEPRAALGSDKGVWIRLLRPLAQGRNAYRPSYRRLAVVVEVKRTRIGLHHHGRHTSHRRNLVGLAQIKRDDRPPLLRPPRLRIDVDRPSGENGSAALRLTPEDSPTRPLPCTLRLRNPYHHSDSCRAPSALRLHPRATDQL